MIRLSPTTSSQTISIIPRAYTVASDTTDHTLNSNKYDQYTGTDTDSQKYIVI